MDAAAVANFALAALALAISGVIAVRQLLIARRTNYLAVSLQLLNEMTAAEFLNSEEYVVKRLGEEHRAERGISGLPEPARSKVWRVAYVYQTVGYLAALRAVDRRMIQYLVGLRAANAWRSLSAFVAVERESNSTGVGFRFFEDLASHCVNLSPANAVRPFRLQSFPETRRASKVADAPPVAIPPSNAEG
jgi:hypothetical protein